MPKTIDPSQLVNINYPYELLVLTSIDGVDSMILVPVKWKKQKGITDFQELYDNSKFDWETISNELHQFPQVKKYKQIFCY